MVDCGSISGGSGKKFAGSDTPSKPLLESHRDKYFNKPRGTMAELQLDPKKTALVLIDLQNAIVGTNREPHTATQVVENSKKLADSFRVHGAPVVYVRVDLNDLMKLPVDQPFNRGDKPLPAAASEITPSAGFQPGDILVTKDSERPHRFAVRL